MIAGPRWLKTQDFPAAIRTTLHGTRQLSQALSRERHSFLDCPWPRRTWIPAPAGRIVKYSQP
jgi:hypothetical protein